MFLRICPLLVFVSSVFMSACAKNDGSSDGSGQECAVGYHEIDGACVFHFPIWTDYEQNPVLESDPTSAWRQLTGEPSVLKDGAIYKMWSVGAIPDSIAHVAYATSDNGVDWEVYPDPVLKPGNDGEWDDKCADTPSVIKTEEGLYEIVYSGQGALPGDPDEIPEALYKIGHATSTDGIQWVKDENNPVLGIDFDHQELPDWLTVADPWILKENSLYKMWYAGVSLGKNPLNETEDIMIVQICYATSPDGTHWEKYENNPVLKLGDPGSWDSAFVSQPSVFRHGETYVMLYVGSDVIDAPAESGSIGIAKSSDGVTWERSSQPIIRKGATGSWKQNGVWSPAGMMDGSRFLMWYSGVKFDDQGIASGIGLAIGE